MNNIFSRFVFRNKINTIVFFVLFLIVGSFFVYNVFIKQIHNVLAKTDLTPIPNSGCFRLNFGVWDINENGGTYKNWVFCLDGIYIESDYMGSGFGYHDIASFDPFAFKIDCDDIYVEPNLNTWYQSYADNQSHVKIQSNTNGLLAYFSRDLWPIFSVGKSAFWLNPVLQNVFKIEKDTEFGKRVLFYVDNTGIHYRLGMCYENKPLTNVESLSVGNEHSCAITNNAGLKTLYCWGDDKFGQAGIPIFESATSTLFGDCGGNERCFRDQHTVFNDPAISYAYAFSAIAVSLPGYPIKVSCGRNQTCAISQDGFEKKLFCWGNNSYQQSKCGDYISTSTPRMVSSGFSPNDITTGGTFSAAINANTILKWGISAGSTGAYEEACVNNAPISISKSNVFSMDMSREDYNRFFCVAISGSKSDQIQCSSNDNSVGQLGSFNYYYQDQYTNNQNSGTSTLVDILPSGLFYVSKVAVGYNHGCFIDTSGGVRCWGDNDKFQLATTSDLYHEHLTVVNSIGSTVLMPETDHSNTPLEISLGGAATDICANDKYSCVIVSGHVKCWGSMFPLNAAYTYGYSSSTPITINNISNATKVSCGYKHACALISQDSINGSSVNNVVKCWGSSDRGLRGTGVNYYSSESFVNMIPTYVTVPYFYNVDLRY